MPRDRGFSLIEMIISTGITMAVVGTVFALVHPAQGRFETELEIADMQQRLRVAVETLTRDLTMAGAGAYAGGRDGPLIHYFAPVLPFRQGLSADDAAGTFRTDTITIISVPATAAQTTLAADLVPSSLTLQAAAGPACPAGTNLCGFAPGMTVLVYDETGNVDTFTIAAVFDAAAQLALTTRPADSAGTTYARGSNLVEARVQTYYLKADAVAQVFQLMRADGSGNADVPVVDHVVGLAFEYFGESSAGTALTPLAAAQLVDGPWYPDDTNANRWDADLLRIRTVGVTVRVEAALAALRGPAGPLFANAGSSRAANRYAPDREIRFQVSPPNMNLGRQ